MQTCIRSNRIHAAGIASSLGEVASEEPQAADVRRCFATVATLSRLSATAAGGSAKNAESRPGSEGGLESKLALIRRRSFALYTTHRATHQAFSRTLCRSSCASLTKKLQRTSVHRSSDLRGTPVGEEGANSLVPPNRRSDRAQMPQGMRIHHPPHRHA